MLAIALDASASSMVPTERHARRRRHRNVIFVVAAVEQVPVSLRRIADDVTVHFPWGSLLRGVMARDEAVLRGLALLCKPDAAMAVLLSITDREHALGLGPPTVVHLEPAYRSAGLLVDDVRHATPYDVSASRSSWAKRLRVGSVRDAWLVRARALGG